VNEPRYVPPPGNGKLGRVFLFLGLGVAMMLTIATVFALKIRKAPTTAPPCIQPLNDPDRPWTTWLRELEYARCNSLHD
jgi:hypothetical protein